MNFKERVAREIFRFERPGEALSGVLMEIDSVEIQGRPTVRYTINDPEEKRTYSVLGTIDLNAKIHRDDVGRMIRIRFEKSEILPGRNPKKVFQVFAQSE